MMKHIAMSVLVAALLAGAASAATVSTVDARSFTGEVARLDVDGLTLRSEGKADVIVPLSQLAKVAIQPAAATVGEDILCRLFSGSEIPCSDVALKSDAVTLTTKAVPASLCHRPLNEISLLVFPKRGQKASQILQRCAVREYTNGSKDLLVVELADGKYQSAEGVLLGIDAKEVRFRFGGKDRTVARKKVRAIFLSRTLGPLPEAKVVAMTTTGAKLACTSITIDKTVSCVLANGKTHRLDRSALASLSMASDTLVALTDIKPVTVVEKGLMDVTFPHRVGRNVAGGPITLGGKQYAAGLGLHSFCELTYDLAGKYSQFLTLAGIDDATGGRGDATLTILGDGKVLKTIELKGATAPVELRIKVAGVKKLMFRVDFGSDKLGVCDHVDLANPRLVK